MQDPHNLAPICGPCNRGKAARVFTSAPMSERLIKAGELRDKVIRRVLDFDASSQIAQLAAAATTDLHRPAVREAFVEHAPVIVQALADIDQEAADFILEHHCDIRFGEYVAPTVLSLDARGRALHFMATEFCGSQWSSLLADGLSDIVTELVEHGLELVVREFGDADQIQRTDIDSLDMTASPSGFARLADMLVINYTGLIYGAFNATGVANNIWGDGDPPVISVSAEAYVAAHFELSAKWRLSADIPPSLTCLVSWLTEVDRSRP